MNTSSAVTYVAFIKEDIFVDQQRYKKPAYNRNNPPPPKKKIFEKLFLLLSVAL